MKYKIRKAKRSDCKDIAHVVTVAWNETYRDIVPDEILDSLYVNENERARNSYDHFGEDDDQQFVLETDGKIVGFMNIGYAEDIKFGEIHALYILNEHKHQGLGRKMIERGIEELRSMNCCGMVIGCLDGNDANGFYSHLSGKLIGTRIFEKLQLPENVYYFSLEDRQE